MKELMKKRQQTFRTQCVKYSRYVLNDHFVLFMLIFIGFLAVQYSQFLQDLPKDTKPDPLESHDWFAPLGSDRLHCDLLREARCFIPFSKG